MDIQILLNPRAMLGSTPVSGRDGVSGEAGPCYRSLNTGESCEDFGDLLSRMINSGDVEGLEDPAVPARVESPAGRCGGACKGAVHPVKGEISSADGEDRESSNTDLPGDVSKSMADDGESEPEDRLDETESLLSNAVLVSSLPGFGNRLEKISDLRGAFSLSRGPETVAADEKTPSAGRFLFDRKLRSSLVSDLGGISGRINGIGSTSIGLAAGSPEGLERLSVIYGAEGGSMESRMKGQNGVKGLNGDLKAPDGIMNGMAGGFYDPKGVPTGLKALPDSPGILSGNPNTLFDRADALPNSPDEKPDGYWNGDENGYRNGDGMIPGNEALRPQIGQAAYGMAETYDLRTAAGSQRPFGIRGDSVGDSAFPYERELNPILPAGGHRRNPAYQDGDSGSEGAQWFENQGFEKAFELGSDAVVTVKVGNGSAFRIEEVEEPFGAGGSGMRTPEWVSDYKSEIIGRMADRITFDLARGRQRVTVQLEPESLGKVEVILVSEADKIRGFINVEETLAGEIIGRSLPELRQALIRQGLPAGEFQLFQNRPDMMMAQFGNSGQGRERETFDADTRRPVVKGKAGEVRKVAVDARPGIRERFAGYPVQRTIDIWI